MRMAPEIRHTIEDSLQLCHAHHNDYDRGRMMIDAVDPIKRCEGALHYTMRAVSYHEDAA